MYIAYLYVSLPHWLEHNGDSPLIASHFGSSDAWGNTGPHVVRIDVVYRAASNELTRDQTRIVTDSLHI